MNMNDILNRLERIKGMLADTENKPCLQTLIHELGWTVMVIEAYQRALAVPEEAPIKINGEDYHD
jgi:hypothetical protein